MEIQVTQEQVDAVVGCEVSMSGLRRYECEFYAVMVPPKHCLFCDHCTDVFWDYTHGPYMFICDVAEDTEKGDRGECPHFREETR